MSCDCDWNSGYECGFCIAERQDRQAAEEFAFRNPIKCICGPYEAFHTVACRNQDWSKNSDEGEL